MNEFVVALLSALLRTGLVLTAAALVIPFLLAACKVGSPTIRRTAYLAVVVQGWVVVQWPVEIPTFPGAAPPAAQPPGSRSGIPNGAASVLTSLSELSCSSGARSIGPCHSARPRVALVSRKRSAARGRQRRKSSSYPGREAVVDVAHIFKNLDAFERELDELKAEVEKASKSMKQQVGEMSALSERLKKLDRDDGEDRLLAKLIEKELAQKKSEMEKDTAARREELLRREAEIYEKTYDKIAAEVARYAKQNGIRIVRRVCLAAQREEKRRLGDPKEILQRINQDIVYIERDELDITEDILKRLQPKEPESDQR
jgi:Skp family chaperone for outer membrane proteins